MQIIEQCDTSFTPHLFEYQICSSKVHHSCICSVGYVEIVIVKPDSCIIKGLYILVIVTFECRGTSVKLLPVTTSALPALNSRDMTFS